MRNHTGPQARSVALRLTGNCETVSRDAIGARVAIDDGSGRPLAATLRAGEGFLGQSSKWLHFGLGERDDPVSAEIRWPDGTTQRVGDLMPDRRYAVAQGSEAVALPPRAGINLPAADQVLPEDRSGARRIPAQISYRMPALTARPFGGTADEPVDFGGGEPVFLSLWASWCAPCLAELRAFAAALGKCDAAGLRVVALALDGIGADDSDPAAAAAVAEREAFPFRCAGATELTAGLLQKLALQVTPSAQALPIPSSFLIGGDGRLLAIYKGPVVPNQVIADLRLAALTRAERAEAAASEPGGIALEKSVPQVAAAIDQMEAAARFELASQLWAAGRIADSAAEYKDLLNLKPDFAAAWSDLALASLRLGDIAAADDQVRRALALDPGLAEAHFNLGALHDQRGDLAEAAAAYQRARSLKPKLAGVAKALGVIAAKSGRLGEARAHFAAEVEIAPEDGKAHNYLGLAMLQLGETEAAKAALHDAVRLRPGDPDARNNLGTALKRLGDLDGAIAQYAEAARLAPRFPEAHQNLGLSYLAAGNSEKARAAFQAALRANPNFTPAREQLKRLGE
ncbi:MAG: tetratricopeptide repeat protein [Verrucomicrobiales bacterium]